MSPEFKNLVILKAVETYGDNSQINMAVEKMSELAEALMLIKSKRKDVNKQEVVHNLAEKIADVEIMLEQLKLIFNCFGLVEREKEYKINRLAERLERLKDGEQI